MDCFRTEFGVDVRIGVRMDLRIDCFADYWVEACAATDAPKICLVLFVMAYFDAFKQVLLFKNLHKIYDLI